MGNPRRPSRNWADRMRPLRRIAGPIESAQIRRFGRSGLSVLFRTPVLVLETVGRRSGVTRITPLAYRHEIDGSFLVIAGAGGQTELPDWVANLRANPEARVLVNRRSVAVRAIELVGDEHDDIWSEVAATSPRIEVYARRAGHRAPMVRLVPQG